MVLVWGQWGGAVACTAKGAGEGGRGCAMAVAVADGSDKGDADVGC